MKNSTYKLLMDEFRKLDPVGQTELIALFSKISEIEAKPDLVPQKDHESSC